MSIKAIALDIDGTLTNDAKVVTPRTKEALLAAQRSGIRLILSSGRPVQGLRAIAAELELQDNGGLLVAFNGACVIDAQTDEVLFDQPMEERALRALVGHMRDFDVIPWITEGKYPVSYTHLGGREAWRNYDEPSERRGRGGRGARKASNPHGGRVDRGGSASRTGRRPGDRGGRR